MKVRKEAASVAESECPPGRYPPTTTQQPFLTCPACQSVLGVSSDKLGGKTTLSPAVAVNKYVPIWRLRGESQETQQMK
ncbi:hypothetical protein PoB_007278600 [Plakobranchus ocellatus]|uniref:Uncharacterized protein n=1 Tax=Plakobranchus ocellatus TaxID=259542 RepID=A0AAV4DQ92_9GAST|nr:hypothetical protein PoB_007278600 [Plakobranchus ocellatus]